MTIMESWMHECVNYNVIKYNQSFISLCIPNNHTLRGILASRIAYFTREIKLYSIEQIWYVKLLTDWSFDIPANAHASMPILAVLVYRIATYSFAPRHEATPPRSSHKLRPASHRTSSPNHLVDIRAQIQSIACLRLPHPPDCLRN